MNNDFLNTPPKYFKNCTFFAQMRGETEKGTAYANATEFIPDGFYSPEAFNKWLENVRRGLNEKYNGNYVIMNCKVIPAEITEEVQKAPYTFKTMFKENLFWAGFIPFTIIWVSFVYLITHLS